MFGYTLTVIYFTKYIFGTHAYMHGTAMPGANVPGAKGPDDAATVPHAQVSPTYIFYSVAGTYHEEPKRNFKERESRFCPLFYQ